MKRISTRILAYVLTFIMVLTVFPASAYAEESASTEVNTQEEQVENTEEIRSDSNNESADADVEDGEVIDESVVEPEIDDEIARRPDFYIPPETDETNAGIMTLALDDYRTWSQGDARWGSIYLGSSGYTVANSGCLVTSVTKLIIQSGLKSADDFDISTFMNWMNNNGGFTGDGGMYWAKPSECVSEFQYAGKLLTYGVYSSSEYNDQIVSWVKSGYHIALAVNYYGHWVAVDEAMTLATGQVYIMDSLTGMPNADITLASRYTDFNEVAAYKGGKTNTSLGTVKQTITGFVDVENPKDSIFFSKSEKPSLDSLVASMPKKLDVCIGNNVQTIDVSWECVGEDYEASDAYYFQFSPIWDEEKYTLSEDYNLIKDGPYISVFLYDNESGISTNAVTNLSNETIIYEFLKEEMGLNTAAACGVLANIYHESAFNPNAIGDQGTSYGICQWHNSRWDNMKTWCNANGYDWKTLNGQLNFLKRELSGSDYLWNGKTIYDYLLSVPDTAEGAYLAGHYWCTYFEVPANTAVVAVTRGNLAQNTYWPEYAGDAGSGTTQTGMTITNHSEPGTLVTGNVFSVQGLVKSSTNLKQVSVECVSVDGSVITGKSAYPNAKSYDLSGLDYYILFNIIEPGVYKYNVTATDSYETKTLVSKTFIVLAKNQTVSEGKYILSPYNNGNYALQVSDKSSQSGANVNLQKKTNSAYQILDVTYAENGYYTLEFVGSKNLLTAASGTSAGTNVMQQTSGNLSAQKWQILPVGETYCLVPMSAKDLCLNIAGDTYAAGANIEIGTPDLTEYQRFSMVKTQPSLTVTNSSDNSSEKEENLYEGTGKAAVVALEREDYYGSANEQPKLSGYVFAGWFQDVECTKVFSGTSGTNYAKFVDENVLTVKAQITYITASNPVRDLRFVTTVDSLRYNNVGFKLNINGKETEKITTSVYEQIKVKDTGETLSLKPTLFSSESKYFMTYRLNNIPESSYSTKIIVTPFWTTLDGTRVMGTQKTYTVSALVGATN